MTRRVLVTGASGFLGQHLLRAMAADATAWTPLIAGRLESAAEWGSAPDLSGTHTIVHLAALVRHSRENADEVFRTNVGGTLEMVRLAARLGCRLVYVSTSGTVGCFATSAEQADEDAPFCIDRVRHWPYYASKVAAEQQATALAGELGVELVILRPPVMLGPEDHRGRSTSSVRRVLEGKVPVVFAGGMHFVDVRDVAAAILAAARHENPRPVYHLAGMECSLTDFFRRVARLGGVELRAPTIPASALRAAARINSRLGRFGTHVLPDPVVAEMATSYWGLCSRYAEAELAFTPRDADVTLRDTIDWLRS